MQTYGNNDSEYLVYKEHNILSHCDSYIHLVYCLNRNDMYHNYTCTLWTVVVVKYVIILIIDCYCKCTNYYYVISSTGFF